MFHVRGEAWIGQAARLSKLMERGMVRLADMDWFHYQAAESMDAERARVLREQSQAMRDNSGRGR